MRLRSVHALYIIIFLVPFIIPTTPVNASGPSIPIIGRFSTSTIGIRIPTTPKWAHDTVLNATMAWNQAQVWYAEASNQANVYSLVESINGEAVVSFTMPSVYSKIAVGWTDYEFSRSSKIIMSTRTYLDPTVFNVNQGNNVTARRLALWLALHELGRVLGLGSVLDGRDIMDPRATSSRADDSPTLSTLDLYALNVLASGNAPAYVTLPNGIPNQFVEATSFLANSSNGVIPTPEFNGYSGIIASMVAAAVVFCYRRRKVS